MKLSKETRIVNLRRIWKGLDDAINIMTKSEISDSVRWLINRLILERELYETRIKKLEGEK